MELRYIQKKKRTRKQMCGILHMWQSLTSEVKLHVTRGENERESSVPFRANPTYAHVPGGRSCRSTPTRGRQNKAQNTAGTIKTRSWTWWTRTKIHTQESGPEQQPLPRSSARWFRCRSISLGTDQIKAAPRLTAPYMDRLLA